MWRSCRMGRPLCDDFHSVTILCDLASRDDSWGCLCDADIASFFCDCPNRTHLVQICPSKFVFSPTAARDNSHVVDSIRTNISNFICAHASVTWKSPKWRPSKSTLLPWKSIMLKHRPDFQKYYIIQQTKIHNLVYKLLNHLLWIKG